MTRFLTALAVSFFLCLGLTGQAQAKLSCDDLLDVEHSLGELSAELKKVGSIKVGSSMDNELNGLINHIFDMANVEKNGNLTSAAKRMDSTWHAADWKGFRGALDSVIKVVGKMHDRDC